MPLNKKIIENAKPGINGKGQPTDKPYKLGDSGGLFLLVRPNGGKWWRFKYRFSGKENQLSLGSYPDVSLKSAREQRDDLRQLLTNGINPSIHLKTIRKEQQETEAFRQSHAKFVLDNYGALSFLLQDQRYLSLSAQETEQLRTFLDATKDVLPKEK